MSYNKLVNTDRIRNTQSNSPEPVSGCWKQYWSDKSGKSWPKTCRFRGCGDTATETAHVIVNHNENSVYILPMCDYHRKIKECFSVNSGTLAVRIDQEEIITDLEENSVETNSKLHLENGTQVQNIQGTRGSEKWKKFWLRYSESEWPSSCPIRHCMERAQGGAHARVERKDGVFIVPMCLKQNNARNQVWHTTEETIAVRVALQEDLPGI